MPWWHIALMTAFAFAYIRGLAGDRLRFPERPEATAIAAGAVVMLAYLSAIRPDHVPPWGIVAGTTVFALMWLPNRTDAWLGLTLAGGACNLAVIVANGGAMPIDAPIWLELPRHYVPLTADTRLALLGDHLPVPGMPLILSPGDLMMFAGNFVFAIVQYWHEIRLLTRRKNP